MWDSIKKTYLIYKHRWNRILDQWDSSGLKQNHRRAKAKARCTLTQEAHKTPST